MIILQLNTKINFPDLSNVDKLTNTSCRRRVKIKLKSDFNFQNASHLFN